MPRDRRPACCEAFDTQGHGPENFHAMFSRSAWALRSLSASVGGPALGAHICPLPSCGGGGQGPLGPVPLQPGSPIKLPGTCAHTPPCPCTPWASPAIRISLHTVWTS